MAMYATNEGAKKRKAALAIREIRIMSIIQLVKLSIIYLLP